LVVEEAVEVQMEVKLLAVVAVAEESLQEMFP
jgi:hypothetical protein